jgi:hypothetical protein
MMRTPIHASSALALFVFGAACSNRLEILGHASPVQPVEVHTANACAGSPTEKSALDVPRDREEIFGLICHGWLRIVPKAVYGSGLGVMSFDCQMSAPGGLI